MSGIKKKNWRRSSRVCPALSRRFTLMLPGRPEASDQRTSACPSTYSAFSRFTLNKLSNNPMGENLFFGSSFLLLWLCRSFDCGHDMCPGYEVLDT